MTDQEKENDLRDLAGYAEDHLRNITALIGPSLDGDAIDHIVASATYARRRLAQLIDQVLEEAKN